MILPQTAEYALRAIACVAAAPAGEGLTARDLSERAAIPPAYLSKILRKLVVAGLLTSAKGHHGGFRLARPRTRVRLLDVLAAVEYEPRPEACAFGWRACDAAHPCPLHPAWSRLKDTFFEWAAQTTLADLGSDLEVLSRRAARAPRRSQADATEAKPRRGRRPKARARR